MKWLDKLIGLKKKPKRRKIKVYEDEYVALKLQSSFYYTEYKKLKEKLNNE